jgi:hypothetical protein
MTARSALTLVAVLAVLCACDVHVIAKEKPPPEPDMSEDFPAHEDAEQAHDDAHGDAEDAHDFSSADEPENEISGHQVHNLVHGHGIENPEDLIAVMWSKSKDQSASSVGHLYDALKKHFEEHPHVKFLTVTESEENGKTAFAEFTIDADATPLLQLYRGGHSIREFDHTTSGTAAEIQEYMEDELRPAVTDIATSDLLHAFVDKARRLRRGAVVANLKHETEMNQVFSTIASEWRNEFAFASWDHEVEAPAELKPNDKIVVHPSHSSERHELQLEEHHDQMDELKSWIFSKILPAVAEVDQSSMYVFHERKLPMLTWIWPGMEGLGSENLATLEAVAAEFKDTLQVLHWNMSDYPTESLHIPGVPSEELLKKPVLLIDDDAQVYMHSSPDLSLPAVKNFTKMYFDGKLQPVEVQEIDEEHEHDEEGEEEHEDKHDEMSEPQEEGGDVVEPAWQMLASAEDMAKLQANRTEEHAVLAAYFKQEHQVDDNEAWKGFRAAGSRLSQEYPTGLISGGEAAEAPHKAAFPSLVVFSTWEDPKVFTGPWTEEAIEGFVRNESHPLAQELNWEVLNFYLGRTAPMMVFYFDAAATNGVAVVKLLTPIATKYKHKFSFLAANNTEFERQLEVMGLNKSHAPTLVIDELDRQYQHPGKSMGDFTTLSIDAWLVKYFKNELEAMPIPGMADADDEDMEPGEPEDLDHDSATDDMTAEAEHLAEHEHEGAEEESPALEGQDEMHAEEPDIDPEVDTEGVQEEPAAKEL